MRDRYADILIRRAEDRTIRRTAVYPEVPASVEDIYVISTLGDRFDTLAASYYGSSRYWWVIAANNPLVDRSSLHIVPGLQIRIPLSLERALNLYTNTNRNR